MYILLYRATDTVLYTYIVVLLFYHYYNYQLPHRIPLIPYSNTNAPTNTGIGNDTLKELRDFELDTSTMTSYETANALWDMIETNQEQ